MKYKMVLVVLYCFCWHLCADDENLKVRVQQLEEQVKVLTQEVVELRQTVHEQNKVVENVANKVEEDSPPYQDIIQEIQLQQANAPTFGYFHKLKSYVEVNAHFEFSFERQESSDEEEIFELSLAAVQLHTSFNDWIHFYSEIAIENSEDVLVSYANLVFSFHPAFNVKAGVITVPFGYYNRNYIPALQELTSVPLTNQHIVPTIWGEPGVSVFGNVKNVGPVDLNYEILVSNGLGEGGFRFIEGNRDARQDFDEDNNTSKQWSGRLGIVPRTNLALLDLEVGLSGLISRYDDLDDNQYDAFAIDGRIKMGEFSFIGDHDYIEIIGEYVHFYIESDDRIELLFADISNQMLGYYIQVNYSFFPENWRGTGIFTEESSFTLAVRYEKIDLDTGQKGASQLDDQKIYTVGINFRPLRYVAIKAEYNWIREFINGDKSWNNRVLLSVAAYF